MLDQIPFVVCGTEYYRFVWGPASLYAFVAFDLELHDYISNGLTTVFSKQHDKNKQT